MSWWKVEYIERHRNKSVALPSEALNYIGKIYNMRLYMPYAFDYWPSSLADKPSFIWTRTAQHNTTGNVFRVRITCIGRPDSKKQIIKVMANTKLKRKDTWKKYKRAKGWFFHKARRRGQQKYIANRNKSGGKKDGNKS